MKAIKSLGQNFLNDLDIVNLMVNALEIQNKNQIIEIGPGQGSITKSILKKDLNFNLDVYEIDNRFLEILKKLPKEKSIAFNIYNENFLDINLNEKYKDKETKIIGAIPYYITSPIIHTLLKMETMPTTIVLLIQKEVAEKINSEIPRSNYWSMFTTMYKKEIVQIVNPEAFTPAPKVKSAILKLELIDNKFPIPIQKWSKFLHLIYKNPRKMINKVFEPEILKKANIKSNIRPQNLSFDDCLNLYDIIKRANE